MSESRRPYPSDLSDAEEALLARRLPRKWSDRLIADAIFYALRRGCGRRMLPPEFPPWARGSLASVGAVY